MNNNEFIEKLIRYKFVDPIWNYLSKVILEPLVDDNLLKLFSLYFVFISGGSSCMPLERNLLLKEWKSKCDGNIILLTSEVDDEEEKGNIKSEIISLYKCGEETVQYIDKLPSLSSVIGDNKLFIIHNNFLFARKYFRANEGIKEAISRLFINFNDNIEIDFNVKKIWKTASLEQEEFVKRGICKNLILCGGPGTGKTTAVFYLLIALLKSHRDYDVYLTAPSGKAASRIKESIDEEIEKFNKNNPENKEYEVEINKLMNVNKYTIHKLLEIDFKDNGFIHSEKKMFNEKSIFIIDEASMIDVCLFDSLLRAIPSNSRVFILGDKHQLPSVECGAVLSDLLAYPMLKNNIIELKESHRFVKGSDVYNLSIDVNDGKELSNLKFKSFDNFEIEKNNAIAFNYPVYYYEEKEKSKKTFEELIEEWGETFYSDNEEKCTDVPFDENELDLIYKNIDEARILCAENEGRKGVKVVNNIIKNKVIKESRISSRSYSPGVPLMITENNKALDLDNGDTGIVIRLKNCVTPYFLIAKSSSLYPDDSKAIEDKILKLGKYLLYPLRVLDLKKLTLAYAITIHKSQGSGYNNILVILPSNSGHPLLNRQIIYTAITRTKGVTYIISNIDRMNEAISNIAYRYTRIFD